MTAGDLSIEPVARHLLGDPIRAQSTKTQWRCVGTPAMPSTNPDPPRTRCAHLTSPRKEIP